MNFNYSGKVIMIEYEESDTDTEKRIVEQGIALLRNLLIRFKEVADSGYKARVGIGDVKI